ncbi:MAG: sigma-70 family RNA polymerase sigma factor [Pseudomonadota bacterium]
MTTTEHKDISASELCSRIVQGDNAAETVLYERYRRGTLFFLTRESGDPELASDLVHDTLLKVIVAARAGEIREPSALNGYVRSTARNMLIAWRRKEARRDTTPVDPQDGDPFPDNKSISILEDLKCSQLGSIVDLLLSQLRVERDRDVLIRLFLHDEDRAAICDRWDLSPTQLDSVLHRARTRLRTIASQHYDEQELSDMMGRASVLILFCLLSPGFSKASVQDFEISHHLITTEVSTRASV